ncbi:DUF4376 domain-containing protein [Halomonas pacifica]|uniref:DUF4376 domain-containing protein n=1 Tax=Bisbaumannia pacifica TaxID=77098 RepID=UPI002358ABC2|nr:DUF4376 domain-containing protein [Halomonas pacifica]MDC8802554.1 DUF4376 domain-containing protein [Halomonas pacifica]
MMYVETATATPTTLTQIRQANPTALLARSPTDHDVGPLGYAVLHPSAAPEGDVVTLGTPEQRDDGRWYQTWNVREFTPEERTQQLADAKAAKRQEIDRARDDAFAAGLPYEIAGEPDVVQTRLADKINLLGLRMEAQELKTAGVTDAVMPFRGLSNVQRHLTPDDMIALTNAALAHIQQIYQHSWQLKDAVDDATILADVEAIAW